jgi:Raf kinase inhibitor-like YbhB/YbcL family protein
MTMTIDSPAFADHAEIPSKFTCESGSETGASPQLRFRGVPADAKSLVLIVDDPDAPDPRAPKMTWVHWVLYDMPPSASDLAEAVSPERLPPGTREGVNDWKKTGWGGPCPPIGRHRYFFKLYALDTMLGKLPHGTKAEVEKAMQGHIRAQAELVGTYEKKKR